MKQYELAYLENKIKAKAENHTKNNEGNKEESEEENKGESELELSPNMAMKSPPPCGDITPMEVVSNNRAEPQS